MADHRGILVRISTGFAAPADRDDLIQEMMVALWHAIPHFRGDARPSTFIYRVAQNTALVWRRRFNARPPHDELDVDMPAAGPPPPDEQLDLASRDERLYRAIGSLRDIDRSLVLMHLDGLSYREMAEVTGLGESNVGVRLNRARKQLAHTIGETAS